MTKKQLDEKLEELRTECFRDYGTCKVEIKKLIRLKNMEQDILNRCVNNDIE
jgi:hypothetical protein